MNEATGNRRQVGAVGPARPRSLRAPGDAHGFTLIELLVVISIIALLIAVLLPALGEARNAARGVICLSNQRQLFFGMYSYASDFDGVIAKFDSGRGTLSPGQVATSYAYSPATVLQQNNDDNWYRRVVNHGIWMQGERVGPDAYFCPDVDFEVPINANTSTDLTQHRFKTTLRTVFRTGGKDGYAGSGAQVYNQVGYAMNTILNENMNWAGSEMNSGGKGWRVDAASPAFPLTLDNRSWQQLYSAHDGRGYNIAFIDGSATFYGTREIIDQGLVMGSTIGARYTNFNTYWANHGSMPLNPNDDPDRAADGQSMNIVKVSNATTGGHRYARYGRILEVLYRMRRD